MILCACSKPNALELMLHTTEIMFSNGTVVTPYLMLHYECKSGSSKIVCVDRTPKNVSNSLVTDTCEFNFMHTLSHMQRPHTLMMAYETMDYECKHQIKATVQIRLLRHFVFFDMRSKKYRYCHTT